MRDDFDYRSTVKAMEIPEIMTTMAPVLAFSEEGSVASGRGGKMSHSDLGNRLGSRMAGTEI